MNKRFKKINGFVANNTSSISEKVIVNKPTDTDCISMRPSQLDVYKHRNSRFMIVRKPPGAGKSSDIKFVFAEQLEKNTDLKLIITIPQNIIGPGFNYEYLEYPSGKKREWSIRPGLNLSSNGESKISSIIDFLNKKKFVKGIEERILLCSHAGFVQACIQMKKVSFKNTIVVVDEAHHIQSGENEFCSNNLGNIIKKITESSTGGLWLTTATYFRGDGAEILGKDEDKFDNYFLPLDEYFNQLQHIQTYSYDFVPYEGGCPLKEVSALLKSKNRQKKTIIYVPSIGRLWSEECKKQTVAKLTKAIRKVWKKVNIIDLVNEDGRGDRKKDLIDNKYDSDIDIVLAVNLLDEGTDWPEAEQVLDLAPSSSLRVANQRFGRLLRDRQGKHHLSYYTFFPYSVDFSNQDKCKETLDKTFAALSLSFMIKESICPIKLPKMKKVKKEEKKQTTEKINYFRETVKNENERADIIYDVWSEITKKRVDDEIATPSDYGDCIVDVLKRHDVKKNRKKIVQEIEMQFTKTAVPSFDVTIEYSEELDKMRWEKISNHPMKFFNSGKNGKKDLIKIREYYEDKRKKAFEWVKIAEKLAKENSGILNNYLWLKKNGYAALSLCIRHYPELFCHIEKDYKGGIKKNKRVKEAEKIANENGGKLQSVSWLQKNGHKKLVRCMYNNPELFSHMFQEKKIKSIMDHVKNAEKLAKNNGGRLPNYKFLESNGNLSLHMCIRKYPEFFSHIPKERLRKTSEEHLKKAKQLTKENDGILKGHSWLRKNGYYDLSACISQNPELFKGMKQEQRNTYRIIGE